MLLINKNTEKWIEDMIEMMVLKKQTLGKI